MWNGLNSYKAHESVSLGTTGLSEDFLTNMFRL